MSNWRTMTDSTFSMGSLARRLVIRLCSAALSAALSAGALAAAAPLIGHLAPDFALPAVAGSNVRLSEYRGQPVILSFWGSKCGVCGKQLALLDRLYGTYKSSGLVVLGVSVDDDPRRAEEYARARATSYPMLLDSAKNVSRAYAIDRLPCTVLIDRSGTVRYLHADNGADERSYVAQIRTLLDDKPAAP